MQQQQQSVEYEKLQQICNSLLKASKVRPKVGIICGSGLGDLADDLTEKDVFMYENIPHFPVSTVAGHKGCLVLGYLGEIPVVCMKGRFHPYEGYSTSICALPIRVMKLMGVTSVIITNAAGGFNMHFNVGDIMIIKDHINLPGICGCNPLQGKNDERWGARFPPMINAYNKDMISLAKNCFKELQLSHIVKEGVYGMTYGPSYETNAEFHAMKLMGCDAVGMSTVHEVIVAHHCGLKVLGLSLITNLYGGQDVASHEEVVEVGKQRAKDLQRFVKLFVQCMNDHGLM